MTVTAVQASRLLEEVQQIQSKNQVKETNGTQFQDLLGDLVNNVKETERAVRQDMVSLALGETDALHNILINTSKADLAVQTLVAVRNKALDAYNEMMRIAL